MQQQQRWQRHGPARQPTQPTLPSASPVARDGCRIRADPHHARDCALCVHFDRPTEKTAKWKQLCLQLYSKERARPGNSKRTNTTQQASKQAIQQPAQRGPKHTTNGTYRHARVWISDVQAAVVRVHAMRTFSRNEVATEAV